AVVFGHSRHRPSSTLFPYTTLFRSSGQGGRDESAGGACSRRRQRTGGAHRGICQDRQRRREGRGGSRQRRPCSARRIPQRGGGRSEEHTSELQSRENLVCRLLLEKK